MLTITLHQKNWLKIKANYYYVQRIRQIPSATFNPDDKTWMININNISFLEEEFEGELFYKTPRWVILDEEPPEMSHLYTINRNLDVPDMLLEPFDYQNFGIKFMIDKILDEGFVINADGVGLGIYCRLWSRLTKVHR